MFLKNGILSEFLSPKHSIVNHCLICFSRLILLGVLIVGLLRFPKAKVERVVTLIGFTRNKLLFNGLQFLHLSLAALLFSRVSKLAVGHHHHKSISDILC